MSLSALCTCLGRLLPALLGALTLASTISVFANTPVEIPDVALRQCVEQALAKEEGDQITQDDMEDLTDLVDCSGVSNLHGLQFATNLTQLSSSEGGIADLSPLSDLNQLWKIELYRHPVGDLSPLAGLESLINLELFYTETADLSPIATVPLRYLNVTGGTRIRNLPPWSPSAPLANLTIGGTSVTDLSPLAALTQLRYLGLHGLDLSDLDLTVLPRLTSLNALYLADATNVDLDALSGLRNLTELSLSGASMVSDLSSLANHRSLRVLSLARTGLRNLDAVPSSVLAALREVGLYDTLLTEIKPLLSNGGELLNVDLRWNPWLSRNAVETDIPALMARGVEVRYDLPKSGEPSGGVVDDRALRSALVEFLLSGRSSGLPEHGYFYEAPVPADQLARALTLGLSNRGITSLQGMENAERLAYLWLSGNDISGLSPLEDLALQILVLDGNPIGDFGPLLPRAQRGNWFTWPWTTLP